MCRRLRSERGFVLLPAIGAMTVMLLIGLALLTVVNAQSRDAGQQPSRDAAFNLAETALTSSAFALSRAWPTTPTGETWKQQPTCATQSISGGVTTPAAGSTGLAAQVQALVADAWTARGGTTATAPTWSIHVCDDSANSGYSTTWADSGLGAAAYDRNDPQLLAGSPTVKARRVWVRAQATVNGRSRAVASLVQVVDKPVLPVGYAAVAGSLAVNNQVSSALNGLTPVQLVTGLLGGSHSMISGDAGAQLGLRCGLLSDLCLTSIDATLTALPLTSLLTTGEVVDYGGPTAASQADIDALRQQAIREGTYVASLATGASCTSGTPTAGTVTFVEKIGTGSPNDLCTLATTAAGATAGTVVVGSGRVSVTAPTTGTGTGSVAAVVYALNLQNERKLPVVTIAGGATVRGGVYVDGGGILSLTPKPIDLQAVCRATVPLGAILCPTLSGVTALTNAVLNAIGLGGLISQLFPTPSIQADATVTSNVKALGSSGAIQNSFREIPPRIGG